MLIPGSGSVHISKIKNQGVVPVAGRKKSKMEVESLDWLLVEN